MLKAPYNFVPLSDKMYSPDWATKVNHCIPFSDGISGTIHLTITAETPIFVRNGHTKEQRESATDEYKSFSKDQNAFFIPGTSIKGCIRNVMEIMSFGKLTQLDNDSFAFRDLSKTMDGKTYTSMMRNNQPHCGWLKQSETKADTYILEDCGIPELIRVDEIDAHFENKTLFEEFIHELNASKDEEKNARKKYEMLFDFLQKQEIALDNKEFINSNIYLKQKVHNKTLIFTGQPGKRDDIRKKGKYHEFLFGDKVEELIVSEEDIQSFFSIHKNSDDFTKFFQIKLKQGDKIPVFFQKIEDHIYIGLANMYKYPCKHTVYDAIPPVLKNPKDTTRNMPKLDLPETIFGHTYCDSLKGRVQVGHAFARIIPNMEMQEIIISLATPHPSYYPLYIGNGESWNSEDPIIIAGRKRYPTRDESDMFTNESTANTSSIMRPLCRGTVFEGTIRFHNLRPIELGALISAITFHGQTDCYHNIGAGKPLGYGKVKMKIDLKGKDNQNNEISDSKVYLDIFKSTMDKWLDNNWLNTPPITELFSMARGIPRGKGHQFQYMKMSIGGGNNDSEFKNGKDVYAKGERLGTFTEIISNKVPKAKVQPTGMTEYEKRKNWIIDTNQIYHAYINANNKVCICHPERINEKNIHCTYQYDKSSKFRDLNEGCTVKLKVVKKEEKLVKISIIKVVRW